MENFNFEFLPKGKYGLIMVRNLAITYYSDTSKPYVNTNFDLIQQIRTNNLDLLKSICSQLCWEEYGIVEFDRPNDDWSSNKIIYRTPHFQSCYDLNCLNKQRLMQSDKEVREKNNLWIDENIPVDGKIVFKFTNYTLILSIQKSTRYGKQCINAGLYLIPTGFFIKDNELFNSFNLKETLYHYNFRLDEYISSNRRILKKKLIKHLVDFKHIAFDEVDNFASKLLTIQCEYTKINNMAI